MIEKASLDRKTRGWKNCELKITRHYRAVISLYILISIFFNCKNLKLGLRISNEIKGPVYCFMTLKKT